MKAVHIIPGSLKGKINIPPSKSLCHRAIIAAALAQEKSIINNVELSEDISATIEAVQALGAKVDFNGGRLSVFGSIKDNCADTVIDCRKSGSTLRFLMPIGLLGEGAVKYIGQGNLANRPLDPYLEIFKEQGIYYSSPKLPMEVKGKLKPGVFHIKGSISSQFLTGLMFALPILNGDSEIHVTDRLESKGYVDLTIDVLKSFGVYIENHNYQSFFIRGGQKYNAAEYTVEGDYSQAAFWIAAAVLGGEISCLGLKQDSKQGDKAFIDILKAAGAKLEINNDCITASPSSLKAFEADVSQCPDIAPVLAVVAALSSGTSRITGAARLRIKESDRLKAIAQELNKLGADVCEGTDSLVIKGKEYLKGGEVDSWGDHRIAMSLSVAALKCTEPVTINNSAVISKSYPNFYIDFVMLGGNLHERNMG